MTDNDGTLLKTQQQERAPVDPLGRNGDQPATETSGKQFALTLDLENDWYLDKPGYDHLTFEYLDEFITLIDGLDVPLSIFVVGRTLQKFPGAITRLQSELDTEFHLHSHFHEPTDVRFREELQLGKAVFQDHFGTAPRGYRAPYGKISQEELSVLSEEGFKFDSSIFPSYRPGVYNNISAPLEPYAHDHAPDLLEIPLGVVRGLRIPLSQNYLKLFGSPLLRLLSSRTLPDTVVYNIHLQDLYRTDSHGELTGLKSHIMRRNLDRSPELLARSINRILSAGYEPVSMSTIHDRYRNQKVVLSND